MTRDKRGSGRGSGGRRGGRGNRGPAGGRGQPGGRGQSGTTGSRGGAVGDQAGGRGAGGEARPASTAGGGRGPVERGDRRQAGAGGAAGGRKTTSRRGGGGPATPLATVTDGAVRPGRYRLPALIGVRDLRQEATSAGWASAIMDGAEMPDKAGVLDEFARALAFPDWFGNNWDALLDCLADLSWLDTDGTEPAGIVVLWQRVGATAPADPDTYTTACQIVDSAIERRVEAELPPLYVLYPAPADASTDIDPTTGWTLTPAN